MTIERATHREKRELLRGDPRIEFSFQLSDITRQMRMVFDEDMAKLGLTRSQWHTLVHVLRLEHPTQTDLANALDMNRSSAGGLIDQLEKGGFIKRVADKQDRRVWRIKPTPLAEERAENIASAADLLAAKIFSGISPQDLDSARRVLQVLQDNLNE